MKKLLLLSVAALLFAGVSSAQKVKGSGNVITQERTVSEFQKIEAHSAFNVLIKQGSPQSVKVEIDDNIMQYVETKVSNGVLSIGMVSNSRISDVKTMKVYVTVPVLNGVDVSGACNVEFETPVNTNNAFEIELSGASKLSGKALTASSVKVDASGASNMNLEVSAASVDIDASGASKVVLSGKATTQNIDASGASNVDLNNLSGDSARVEASGASNIRMGSAKIESQKSSGASHINK